MTAKNILFRYKLWFLFLLFVVFQFSGCNDNSTSSGPNPDPEPEPDPINMESALPQLSITLQGEEIVDEPKVPATLKVYEEGGVTYNGHIGIEYRGATSQALFDKKSFGIETWDENGNDIDVDLLGFPEEEDWILYGPYSDKTLIRNKFVYTLARDLGHYASRTRFAEVYLDGEYWGMYLFMEKIKRDDVRLDLSGLDPDENGPEEITGGYILKIDKTAGDPGGGDATYTELLGFRSEYSVSGDELNYAPYGGKQSEETYFLYEDPAYEDITDQQKEYIQSYIHEFETALLNDTDGDFDGEYTFTDYVDLDSFVDFFLLNELAHNADAYRLSTFMYKDRGGKLNMGPVWDFNLSMGNDEQEFRRSPETWIYQYNQFIPDDLWLVPFWWEKLADDPMFRSKVKQRWQELRTNEWSDQSLDQLITNLTQPLIDDGAVDRNFKRWPVLGEHVWGNHFVGDTYEEEVQYLRGWLDQRLTWMDAELASW
ncbi:MAG: CotH kinase family protein [Balneolaceae bacterium]|nr:CotH kinase family protein [Balneolaceae bacterium]